MSRVEIGNIAENTVVNVVGIAAMKGVGLAIEAESVVGVTGVEVMTRTGVNVAGSGIVVQRETLAILKQIMISVQKDRALLE